MQRTLDVSGKTRTIHTTNGVDTRTTTVYLRNLRDYTPLPNGFNKELAEEMWFEIVRLPMLWDQGSWRSVVDISGGSPLAEAIREHVNAPKSKARCGTAMCAAGWVAELGGADWVIDNEAVQEGALNHTESILVPVEQWQEYAQAKSLVDDLRTGINDLNPHLQARLQSRGFTWESHVILSVREYALLRLGLTDDYLNMFSANSDYPRIRACLDTYAHFGDLPYGSGPTFVQADSMRVARQESYEDEAHQSFGGDYHAWAKATLERESVDA